MVLLSPRTPTEIKRQLRGWEARVLDGEITPQETPGPALRCTRASSSADQAATRTFCSRSSTRLTAGRASMRSFQAV